MRAPAALAALAALPFAQCRIWSGTLVNQPFSDAIGRFAFGAAGGSASAALSNVQAPATALNWFAETSWRKGAHDCSLNADGTAPINGLPTVTGNPGSNQMWYFALSACTSTAMSLDYTLTATQANGSQLSYEEQGLPAIYACFWIMMAGTVLAHAWAHFLAPLPADYPKGVRPPLVIALTVALALHSVSDTFHLIEWAVVDQTGRDSGMFLAALGGLTRLFALSAIWVMMAFVATGYGITTRSVRLMENNNWRGALLLGILVVLGLTSTLLYATATRAPGAAPDKGAAGVGLTLFFFTIAYLVWFVRRTRLTIADEVSLPKKALLQMLMWVTLGTSLVLPLAEFLSAYRRRARARARSPRAAHPLTRAPHPPSKPSLCRLSDAAVRVAAHRRGRRHVPHAGEQRAVRVGHVALALRGGLPQRRQPAGRRRRQRHGRGVHVRRRGRGRGKGGRDLMKKWRGFAIGPKDRSVRCLQ